MRAATSGGAYATGRADFLMLIPSRENVGYGGSGGREQNPFIQLTKVRAGPDQSHSGLRNVDTSRGQQTQQHLDGKHKQVHVATVQVTGVSHVRELPPPLSRRRLGCLNLADDNTPVFPLAAQHRDVSEPRMQSALARGTLVRPFRGQLGLARLDFLGG
jgi:hypothetical protein